MDPFNWECPHCSRLIIVTQANSERTNTNHGIIKIDPDSDLSEGINVETTLIYCLNPECKKNSIIIREYETIKTQRNDHGREYWKIENGKKIWEKQVYPEKNVRNYPEYIPPSIRRDYKEANLISDISPRASAILSRRCLQGIIRDFWEVTPKHLINEIREIKDKVDSSTWKALNDVREIGNISAHPEKDINIIIDVDPSDAKLLLTLIETLIENHYIARHKRESNLKKLATAADSKNDIRQQNQRKKSL